MSVDLGEYWIKCVKAGGHMLVGYGAKVFTENEEIDLVAKSTPEFLRCADHDVAHNVCTDPSLEIAQLITAGDFEITKTRKPIFEQSTMVRPPARESIGV